MGLAPGLAQRQTPTSALSKMPNVEAERRAGNMLAKNDDAYRRVRSSERLGSGWIAPQHAAGYLTRVTSMRWRGQHCSQCPTWFASARQASLDLLWCAQRLPERPLVFPRRRELRLHSGPAACPGITTQVSYGNADKVVLCGKSLPP